MKKKGFQSFIRGMGLLELALSTFGLIWSIKDKRFDDAYVFTVGCFIGSDAVIHSSYIDD